MILTLMKTPLLYLLLAGINDIARNNIEKSVLMKFQEIL